jgi:adenosylhomocysteinase
MFQEIDKIVHSAYSENEYPVLSWQMEKWSKTKPLSGLSVLDATPVFRNTLLKYKTLLMAGANLSVGISDKLPSDKNIVEKLKEWKIPVVQTFEKNHTFDLVLDCAASFAGLESTMGYVELTRSGVEIYSQKGSPVYLADSGKIKRIETCLGTGESYFRAMKKLGYQNWKNKNLLIFGSGKVGTGIILYASGLGAIITVVTERSSLGEGIKKHVHRIIDLKEKNDIEEAIRQAYAVVTATGIAGAMKEICSPDVFIQSSALLANMGVEDEYGECIPDSRVLFGKKAINFILEEPTLLKYIEATMALHNEGAIYLVKNPEKKSVIIPPAETENEMLYISEKKGLIANDLSLLSAFDTI